VTSRARLASRLLAARASLVWSSPQVTGYPLRSLQSTTVASHRGL